MGMFDRLVDWLHERGGVAPGALARGGNSEAQALSALDGDYEWPTASSPAGDERPWERAYTGEWICLDGVCESQVVVERSGEGFHYSVAVSGYDGEASGVDLSAAYATLEEAKEAGYAHSDRIMAPMENAEREREERQIAEYEKAQEEEQEQER
jgi:hypothetical protein